MIETSVLQNDRGAILVTSLVLLLVLTFLGIVAMQGTTLQERMAGNLEQQDLAFQAAEAGLRDAESWLNNTVVLPSFNGTNGLYAPAAVGATPRWESVDWEDDMNADYRVYQAVDLGNDPPYPLPLYIIEFLTTVDNGASDSVTFKAETGEGYGVYRITSRGSSPNGRSEVILQTTYIR